MSKLDRLYDPSFTDDLLSSNDEETKQLKEKYKLLYILENQTKNNFNASFTGPLQRLVDIKKDVLDTLKPYKSSYYLIRDIMQPFRGLLNILKATLNVALAIPITIAFIPIGALGGALRRYKLSFKHHLKEPIIRIASLSFNAITTTALGLYQLVSTLFNWLVKIPIRIITTAANGGWKPIEKNESLQHIAKEIQKTTINQSTKNIFNEILDNKIIKASKRGQSTRAKALDKSQIITNVDINVKNHLGLLSFYSLLPSHHIPGNGEPAEIDSPLSSSFSSYIDDPSPKKAALYR